MTRKRVRRGGGGDDDDDDEQGKLGVVREREGLGKKELTGQLPIRQSGKYGVCRDFQSPSAHGPPLRKMEKKNCRLTTSAFEQ